MGSYNDYVYVDPDLVTYQMLLDTAPNDACKALIKDINDVLAKIRGPKKLKEQIHSVYNHVYLALTHPALSHKSERYLKEELRSLRWYIKDGKDLDDDYDDDYDE